MNEYQQARYESKKLTEATHEEIASVLKYIIVAIGLRSENLPNQEEKKFIILFLVKNYGTFTLDELRLAIDCSIMGKTSVSANSYQNLNTEYLCSILNGYKRFIQDSKKMTEQPKLESTAVVNVGKEKQRSFCENIYPSFKTIYNDTRRSYEKTGWVDMISNFHYGFHESIYLHLQLIGVIHTSKEVKIQEYNNALKRAEKQILKDDALAKHQTVQFHKMPLEDRKKRIGKALACEKCLERFIFECLELGMEWENLNEIIIDKYNNFDYEKHFAK